jgi:hypothetical protein
MRAIRSIAAAVLLALAPGCASTVVAVAERSVRDELDAAAWRPARAADVTGHWRALRIDGPAAAVLIDLAYWLDADGSFTGAALFAGPPAEYQVLSGAWTLAEDGRLQLGADAELAEAEVAPDGLVESALLRLRGAEGSLVLERAEVR